MKKIFLKIKFLIDKEFFVCYNYLTNRRFSGKNDIKWLKYAIKISRTALVPVQRMLFEQIFDRFLRLSAVVLAG